jgi:hypothetical protein
MASSSSAKRFFRLAESKIPPEMAQAGFQVISLESLEIERHVREKQ